jgi:hypothetical protein
MAILTRQALLSLAALLACCGPRDIWLRAAVDTGEHVPANAISSTDPRIHVYLPTPRGHRSEIEDAWFTDCRDHVVDTVIWADGPVPSTNMYHYRIKAIHALQGADCEANFTLRYRLIKDGREGVAVPSLTRTLPIWLLKSSSPTFPPFLYEQDPTWRTTW